MQDATSLSHPVAFWGYWQVKVLAAIVNEPQFNRLLRATKLAAAIAISVALVAEPIGPVAAYPSLSRHR